VSFLWCFCVICVGQSSKVWLCCRLLFICYMVGSMLLVGKIIYLDEGEFIMTKEDLAILVGEWFGTGKMTVGAHEGVISEHVIMERTDNEERLVYTRHSRIEFPGRVVAHHEVGYTGLEDLSLLLSRGSYVRLVWDEKEFLFKQVDSTPDTRNMKRKIVLSNGHKMHWDAEMEVNQRGEWVKHTIVTDFVLVGVRI